MDQVTLLQMSEHYLQVRKAVYEEATKPFSNSPAVHVNNKEKLKRKITELCGKANLNLYRGTGKKTTTNIWHHLWTKNRYAGIRAQIATTEIRDIENIFDNFEIFSDCAWDIVAHGHNVITAGQQARDFLNREGIFRNRQTIGNVPKLSKIVSVARQLKEFLETKEHTAPVLSFVINGFDEEDVWAIHEHLMSIGYRSNLTVLHFMMDIGFQVIKPDIVITKLFLEWGWLQKIITGIPHDLTVDDLRGKGKYGQKFKYTNSKVYKPVIDLARRITKLTKQESLKDDIGWVTDNPIREFDIFIVKYGQQPESDFGIERTLFNSEYSIPSRLTTCVDQIRT